MISTRGEARVSLRRGCELWVEGEGWRRGEGGIAFVSWMEVDLLLLMDAERKAKKTARREQEREN